MLDLSQISAKTFLGKALRAPLRLIPSNAVLRILQGPARGRKWIAGSATHGCWMGTYEIEKQRLLQSTVRPGDVVYDIGANAGFFTLLTSLLAGTSGRVYAFEPLPGNLQYLSEHIRLNGCSNCTVLEAAVSDKDGYAQFESSESRSEGRLSAGGGQRVRTLSIDSLVKQGLAAPPTVMKIDIEGGEYACLQGAAETIERFRPVIFLATHGPQAHGDCAALLEKWNYALKPIDGQSLESSSEIVAEPRSE